MTTPGAPELREPVGDDDWTRGPADAPATLVEYADFACPFCQRAYPVIERVLAVLGGRVRFVHRHFPVESRHPRALAAALAAEAAGRQGRFWEMHRRLWEARGALSDADLERYAEELGLDLARFRGDLADPALAARIRQERLLGVRSGANGTPTLFLNGVRWDGDAQDEAALQVALEAAAKSSGN